MTLRSAARQSGLTLWTLGQRDLLDARPVPTGKHLHLTQVLVELPVRAAHRIPVVAAVPVARAALKLLLLQAAEHAVALARLCESCKHTRARKNKTVAGWILTRRCGCSPRTLTRPLVGRALHFVASGSVAQLPGQRAALADVVESRGLESCGTSTEMAKMPGLQLKKNPISSKKELPHKSR